MPTYERTERFDRDWTDLTDDQRGRFRAAVRRFVADLPSGRFRAGLRVRGVEGAEGVFEMTWAPNGRATFQYGSERGHGRHVIWRRIGTHDIFDRP
ncbi:hypothetical protein BH20CHL6_BH20CHL6_15540 [soil metagenome]